MENENTAEQEEQEEQENNEIDNDIWLKLKLTEDDDRVVNIMKNHICAIDSPIEGTSRGAFEWVMWIVLSSSSKYEIRGTEEFVFEQWGSIKKQLARK